MYKYYDDYKLYGDSQNSRQSELMITIVIFIILIVIAAFIALIITSIFFDNKDSSFFKIDALEKYFNDTSNQLQDIRAKYDFSNNVFNNENYKNIFDIESFLFKTPGGGKYPKATALCMPPQSGGSAPSVGNPGKNELFENLKLVNTNQQTAPQLTQYFDPVELDQGDINEKIRKFFRKITINTNNYIIFRPTNSTFNKYFNIVDVIRKK